MGRKLVREACFEAVLYRYVKNKNHFAFCTGPSQEFPTSNALAEALGVLLHKLVSTMSD